RGRQMKAFLSRVVALFRSGRLDRELDEEVRLHIDLLTERYRREGMTDRDARAAALREFGGVTQMKETYRDGRGLPSLDTIVQAVPSGLRTLRRTPVFTIAAVLSLGLGIGANTAIFTLINAVMLRSLPVRSPDRLVEPLTAASDGAYNAFSYQALTHF